VVAFYRISRIREIRDVHIDASFLYMTSSFSFHVNRTGIILESVFIQKQFSTAAYCKHRVYTKGLLVQCATLLS
jgi:hypothetical protein